VKEMSSGTTTTRFGLIRHAETVWNRENRIQGHRDSSLTDSGKTDADGWGRRLKRIAWDRIFGSDLGRAVDTAAIINRHLKLPFSFRSKPIPGSENRTGASGLLNRLKKFNMKNLISSMKTKDSAGSFARREEKTASLCGREAITPW
jgi:bisphosphoglycerate-dependent phosphoglycerate mutase